VNDGQRILTESDGLYDVVTVDAFNPFGDYAKAFFDDLDGSLFDLFSRGTKVDFEFRDSLITSGDLTVESGETKTVNAGTTERFETVTVEGELFVEGDLFVERASSYSQDFVGFVVNDFEGEADGAEQLEVEAYTFDQFLRGDEVSSDLSGQTISSALEPLSKTMCHPWSGTLHWFLLKMTWS
jgi:hypothetical protein